MLSLFLDYYLPDFLRHSLNLELTYSLGWLTREPLGPSPLFLPSSGIRDTCHHAHLFTWMLGT